MKTTSNQSKNKIHRILAEEEKGVIHFSTDPEQSDILIYPLCFSHSCCFVGTHQYNLLIKEGHKVKFPYKCKDIYGRTVLKSNPEDLGKSKDKWDFPQFEDSPLLAPSPEEEKFTILDGGCSFVKCFFEFYSWDFEKINFSYIKQFASMLLTRLQKLVTIAVQNNFDAIFLQDEFGYHNPWFPISFFKEELLPLYINLANTIHKHGLLFFLHSCGKVEEIFSLLKGYVDVWHRSDWQDTEEIPHVVNDSSLPLIFVDLTELNLQPPPPEQLKRNYIIGP